MWYLKGSALIIPQNFFEQPVFTMYLTENEHLPWVPENKCVGTTQKRIMSILASTILLLSGHPKSDEHGGNKKEVFDS